MDSGTIIISAILLAVALLPFIFTGRKYKRQKKQLKNMLSSLAEQNQIKLSTNEAGGSFGIGLAENDRYLFFARITNEQMSGRSLLLTDVSRCKIKTASRLLEGGEKIIDRVELVLYPVSSVQPEVVLEMYNAEYDTLTIRDELQIAMKWEKILGGALKETKLRERNQTSSKQAVLA